MQANPMRMIAGPFLLAGIVLVCGSSASSRTPAIESSTWLNTVGGQAPTLAGRPTLVEFWTFG